MEDYYEYLDSNGVTTLYKLIKDDTVALIDSYSVTINGITTNLDNHVNNSDIHTPISDIENMVDTKISGLVNSAPETLDTLKELSDALGNDPNFATTVANQIGNKASKDDVYTKEETDTLLEGKANSKHNHVTSDITDFPTIPTKVSELSNDSNFVTSTELHDYATKNDLNSKQDVLSEEQLSNIDSIPDKANKSDLSTVATSGSYKDLLDKPVIPEGADLSDYYNKGETDNLLNSKANTSDLAVVAKSGNYSDLINTPTIPTKLSQLENDMGFGSGSGGVITSVSWSDITNKPNFSTVATSGSYTDLSNTPTIPTKVSQLENDTGFINALNDVVDTKSNQTINGIKTFTNGPLVTNNGTTIGFSIKNTAIGRGEVPSELYHNTFRVYDKNTRIMGEFCVEKSNSGSTLAQINVRSEDANGKQISRSIYFNMSNDGTKTAFYPNVNNVIDLGMSNNKWKNVYATTFNGNLKGNADTATSANDPNAVHKTGNEAISGAKIFLNDIVRKNTSADLTVTPTGYINTNIIFADKNDKTLAHIENVQRPSGVNDVGIFAWDKNGNPHGIHINTNNEVIPLMSSSESYSLGSTIHKWANVYATTFNGTVHSTTGNAFMAQYGSYTLLIRNDGSNTYFLMSDKDGTPGTWSTARPLIIDNATGVCNINGNANSATYADTATYSPTPATSDNSTRIATTAWVRTYVNSVAGSNTVGSSVSAYWSNSSNVTATGQVSSGGKYPACYSEYITKTPTVGTIYSGAQLYTVLKTYASATGSTGGPPGTPIYYTNTTAQAIFSTPINPSGKYLCTTANTVKFRAYTATGSTSAVGSSSVVDNSSTKSIFIRVQ